MLSMLLWHFSSIFFLHILEMLRKILRLGLASTFLQKQPRRCASFSDLSKWYRGTFYPKQNSPPYEHVCQIGDPVLRKPCYTVDVERIKDPEIQVIIRKMWEVQARFGCVGLSAPQIGVPLQISVMEAQPINKGDKKFSVLYSPIAPRVIINPKLKVLDYKSKFPAPEVCVSVRSFAAEVLRYAIVEVEAYNDRGEREKWIAKGFEARVLQHEIDHLRGVLFTDIMDPKTLECTAWEQVNYYRGHLVIPYGPKKQTLLEKFRFSI